MQFIDLNLKKELLRAVSEMGYDAPSSIQSQAIPVLLDQKDLIGMSQTGSGKTAAFGLPLLHQFVPLENRKTKALILCPTRELCLQVAGEMKKFSKYLPDIRIISVYGGQEISKQIKDIKGGSDIVVATPGRLLDHMRRRTLRLENCSTVVLDEADEMLNMGFLEDIQEILAQLPKERQTVLFSATMPKEIEELAKKTLKDPVQIRIENRTLTVESIEQLAYEVLPKQKMDLLIQLLELHSFESTLIFCNTKKMVDDLSSFLNKEGYKAMALHGDIRQERRTSIMEGFKNKHFRLLVATDVAARGIDVDKLDLVVNFDLPQENEYYIHRIGRTGRAGESGTAISFYSPKQEFLLRQLEKLTKQDIKRKELPTQKELSQLTVSRVEKEVLGGLDAPADRSQHVINELVSLGYSREELLFGLISKLVGDNALETLEPVTKAGRREGVRGEYSTLTLGLGRKHGIKPAHLIAGIADNTGISGKDIGKIKIGERSSTVEVPRHDEARIVEILSQSKINGRAAYVSEGKKDRGDRRMRQPRKRTSK